MKHKGKMAFTASEMSFQGMISKSLKEKQTSVTKIELQYTFICSFNNKSLDRFNFMSKWLTTVDNLWFKCIHLLYCFLQFEHSHRCRVSHFLVNEEASPLLPCVPFLIWSTWAIILLTLHPAAAHKLFSLHLDQP